MRPLYVRYIKDFLANSVGAATTLAAGPPQRFVIFTNGRTGSNLLVSLLKDHPDIKVHSEIFGEYQLEDHGIRRLINTRGAVPYYRGAMKRLTREKFVGLKMIYYNVEASYGATRDVPGVGDVRREILSDPDLKFIHLIRKDRLARLVSNRLALASGNWERGEYKMPIEIDADWARDELERMHKWEEAFKRDLPAERTLNMTYESLVADIPAGISTVFDFLGARPVPVQSDMRKQNKKSFRQSIRNYDELKRIFLGTRHEKLFSE